MEIIINTLSAASLICIGIIIISLLITRLKNIKITFGLIIANIVVFIGSFFIDRGLIAELGFRPMYLSLEQIPQLYTLFTSMFLHADPIHIFGNMLVFFFMGIALEDRIGWKRFFIIYIITGICGALAHSLLDLGSTIPLIGASGAIFGILGAFAAAYPHDEIVMPVPIGIMFIMRIKVIYAAMLFALMETLFVFMGGQSNTAHFAHLGGLVSGIVLAMILLGRQGQKINDEKIKVSYDSRYVPKIKNIDISNLRKLAVTPQLQEMIHRIEHESVPQVRDLWIEHFIEKTRCPVCQKPLHHFDRRVWCEDNHFRTEY
ncbi:MAG: rhomboid family intramembrane serine protease [Candidatus Thermoplasmatota archaeon]